MGYRLEGQTFNYLTVIREIGRSHRQISWLCACICGNESTVASRALRAGKTKSCGCMGRLIGEPLTADRLRSLLSYDPETGVFVWLVEQWKNDVGDVAGHFDGRYVRIYVDGQRYKAQNLAWLHVYGCWPNGILDHEDRVKINNSIRNLREATDALNKRNQPAQRTNKSGYKGVCWHKGGRKWVASISLDNINRYLGLFASAEDAARAYDAAARGLSREFAFLNFPLEED